MVYHGKLIKMDDLGGETHYFWKHPHVPAAGIIYPLKMNIEPKHTTLEKEDTSTTYKPQIPWLPCEFSGGVPIFTTSQFFPPKISGCAPGDTLEVVSPSSGHPIFFFRSFLLG